MYIHCNTAIRCNTLQHITLQHMFVGKYHDMFKLVTNMAQDVPYISTKEPHLSAKEPFISIKEPYLSAKES